MWCIVRRGRLRFYGFVLGILSGLGLISGANSAIPITCSVAQCRTKACVRDYTTPSGGKIYKTDNSAVYNCGTFAGNSYTSNHEIEIGCCFDNDDRIFYILKKMTTSQPNHFFVGKRVGNRIAICYDESNSCANNYIYDSGENTAMGTVKDFLYSDSFSNYGDRKLFKTEKCPNLTLDMNEDMEPVIINSTITPGTVSPRAYDCKFPNATRVDNGWMAFETCLFS